MPDLLDWLLEHESSFRKSRLPSLYSDLSVQKATNPEGYSANVLAWQAALTRAAVAGQLSTEHRLILESSEELLDALASPQYGRPSGLGLVLDESVGNGKMIGLQDFEHAEQSIYHHNWIPSPMTILKWGLRQAGLAGGAGYDMSGRLRSGQLVLIPALEDMYKQISAVQKGQGSALTDRVMTREQFSSRMARLNDTPLSPQDTEILLRYLSRDKGLLSYDSKTVKFRSPAANAPEPITQEDATIADLRSLISGLEFQISNLNVRIATLQSNAKAAVEAKNKNAALTSLKSKKLAERTLQQRSDTLTQLEEVYSKIEQAVDQVQIVEAMQGSASVLKSLHKKVGGVERVEDVVEELREEMSKVDEVGQVLQEPLDPQMTLDESEVDDELEQMEKEERRREEEKAAEATAKRLAELEAAQQQKNVAEQTRAVDEEKLASSIEQLEQMKLGEGDRAVKSTTQRREKISEQAS